MSTVYDKTDNYSLNLYGDNDPADLRDGYNGSMRTIDATLETHLNRIEGVESRETHDEEVVKALLGDNTVNAAAAAKTKWNKAGDDATAAGSKAENNAAILAALGAGNAADANMKQTKWDNAANKVDALEPRVGNLERRGATYRNIVVLGDSWTVVHNNALYDRLKSDIPYAEWHNYGKAGAVVQQLTEEVDDAKKDTNLHAGSVTDVIIIMGTNNVFWTKLNGHDDITEDSSYNAFKTVRDYFPNADIRFFPNNSKTLNGARNNLYQPMLDGARKAGVGVHEESLILLCGHVRWYNGDDQEGVQHLSDQGYQQFADSIANVIVGGSMYSDGLMESIQSKKKHSNPSSLSEVDDNTITVYQYTGSYPLKIIGYMTDAEVSLYYHSDQTVDIHIKGNITITGFDASKGRIYLGCQNWYKHISKNTLPYVFFNGDIYEHPMSVTYGSEKFEPTPGVIDTAAPGSLCWGSFYINIPVPAEQSVSSKEFEMWNYGNPSSVTGYNGRLG